MCSYVWLFSAIFFLFSVQQLLFQFFFVLPYFILTVVLFGFVFFFGSFKLWVCLGTAFHKIREISLGKLSLLQKIRRRLILQKIASAVKVSNREEIE